MDKIERLTYIFTRQMREKPEVENFTRAEYREMIRQIRDRTRQEGRMVSDNHIQVWQDGDSENGYVMKIQTRYLDDPRFTLEQERIMHGIARSFLMVNRQTARRKRYADKKKGERTQE